MAAWPLSPLFTAALALLVGWSVDVFQLIRFAPRSPLTAVVLAAVFVVIAVLCGVYFAMDAVYRSIQPLPPTERQIAEVDSSANPLFRFLPAMARRIAWRPLGDFPTPVDRMTLRLASGKEVTFWVKREDRASSLYGGNKVRPLQYQLATCEAHVALHPSAQLLVLGSTGSNQCVAALVHGRAHCGLQPTACWLKTERPSLDNLLNLLSCLSLPGDHAFLGLTGLARLLQALFLRSKVDRVFPIGGNNPLGQLGHVGAALELAEQIEKGELPDPRAIYLTAGSMCTFTGLILGICLTRALGLQAFQHPEFTLYAVHVHHLGALMHRYTGSLYSSWLPMGVRRSIRETSALLQSHGAPAIEAAALQFLEQHTYIETDPRHVGKYGDHSVASKAAKDAVDLSATFHGEPLWLCGHFTAKGFSLLHKHLESSMWDADATGQVDVLFWSSKSLVQPHGVEDEWKRLQALPRKVRAWTTEVHPHDPDSCRQFMSDIVLPPTG